MSDIPQYPISVMFTSRNMQKAVAFYRDMLGFQMKESWPDDKNPMWASLMLDRQVIMLGAHMSPEAATEMCGGDPGSAQYMKTLAEEFQKNQPGVGIVTYVQVPDVDRYHASLVSKGVKNLPQPKTQFYGLRDFCVQDPDGYRLLFYTPIKMDSCQSCGMPLQDAQPGQMYCHYCTDEKGTLRPFEKVLEGTTSGYFMAMKKLPRPEAETAARAHLATMPAWKRQK